MLDAMRGETSSTPKTQVLTIHPKFSFIQHKDGELLLVELSAREYLTYHFDLVFLRRS